MNCPYCAKEMEGGFFRAGGGIAGIIEWSRKDRFLTKVENLGHGMAPLRYDAFRCANCKAILFRY
jgi:hypothetical protein